MEKINFNNDWTFSAGERDLMASLMGKSPVTRQVDLPHDAMVLEERRPDTGNGGHTGYYPGGSYTYTKQLDVPEDWKDKDIYLEFEGVFAGALVYVNDDLAIQRPYGYSEFHVLLNDYLVYDGSNEIKVLCNTQVEHQSRWYTGSGIYRHVNLYIADPLHTSLHGVRIVSRDIEAESAVAEINLTVENNTRSARETLVKTKIIDKTGATVNETASPLTVRSNSTTELRQRLAVDDPLLWSFDHPDLYTCRIEIFENDEVIDARDTIFGIRKLQLDARHGLRINGIETKLRGTCIHHDNGVLGAATFERSEERRVEQLKAAGFNCIRSSHNPASRAMLDACDRLGILMIDEAFDVWMKSKTANDYSNFFLDWWERDIESMVNKDLNHPCVIIYSLGNELPEISNRFGNDWNRKMAAKIRSIDDTRYLTNSLNLMFMKESKIATGQVLAEMGIDLKAKSAGSEESADSGGANALNSLMALMSGPVSDKIMAHEIVDENSNEFLDGLDIAGVNYAPAKYAADGRRHPNRVILGTEDYPGDIVRLWGEVKKHSHVIGDMTWTGYDYLGEAGSGTFSYDGRMTFGAPYPARTAGMGDIDLIGNRHPLSYLREIVYGLRKAPYIGVERVNRYGQDVKKTPWKLHDDIASWTWPGYEGKPAKVYVYSASDEVELLLNGQSLGRQPAGETNGYTAVFETAYQPGELVAVGYTAGQEDGRMQLQTASDDLYLDVQSDATELKANGSDLSYVMIRLCDEGGNWNRAAKKMVRVSVEGAGVLQGLGNADPYSEDNFFDDSWETYDGALLAVVRSGKTPGDIRLCVSAEGCEPVRVGLKVKACHPRL